MLNEIQRKRMAQLRDAETQGTLTDAEQAELSELFQIIYDAEAVYLKPAIAAMEQKRKQLEAENARMRSLMQRRKDLLSRLQQVLEETRAEWEALDTETKSLAGADAMPVVTGAIR